MDIIRSGLDLYVNSRDRMHALPSTDVNPGVAGCVVAIKASLLSGTVLESPQHWLLSTIILNSICACTGRNSNAHFYHIWMLQVLCLDNLAFQAYKKLKVKELLIERCAPTFFARISFSHPHTTKSFNPVQEITNMLLFFTKSHSQITKYQRVALQEKNYAQALQLDKFAMQIRTSFCYRMLIQERRRILRITSQKAFSISPDGTCSISLYRAVKSALTVLQIQIRLLRLCRLSTSFRKVP